MRLSVLLTILVMALFVQAFAVVTVLEQNKYLLATYCLTIKTLNKLDIKNETIDTLIRFEQEDQICFGSNKIVTYHQ